MSITIIVELVLAVITIIGAGVGLNSRSVASAAEERADQLEKLRLLDKEEASRQEEQCQERIQELKVELAEQRQRVDDLTSGWLDRLAPQAAQAMAPHIVDALRHPITNVVREALQ